jgi:hypothetical protein
MTARRDIVHALPERHLKVATRALVALCGGGEGAAATVGGRQQRMSDCGNVNTADFLRLDEVAALEDVAGDWPVTRALAKRAGCVLLRLPDLPMSAENMVDATTEIIRETADVMTEMSVLFADGRVTAAESARFSSQVDEAVSALMKARNLVQDWIA